jgi:hypothetical protein
MYQQSRCACNCTRTSFIALPKTEQSLAYLLRNDILGNVQDLRAELAFMLTLDPSTSATAADEYGPSRLDALLYARQAQTALQQYLQIVSPTELQRAQDLLRQSINTVN